MNEKQIKVKMAEESIGSLAPPLQNRGLDALEQESSQIGSLAAPVTAPEGVNPDDPFELFRASIDTGLANTQANTQNFRAAVASLLGNDEDAENLLDNANLVQQAGAQYLVNTERFEEFLDQPTLGGFINQANMATGQCFSWCWGRSSCYCCIRGYSPRGFVSRCCSGRCIYHSKKHCG